MDASSSCRTNKRMQRLAVVVEEPGRGVIRVDLTRGWRETHAVAREALGLGPGLRVYVTTAEAVTCRWRLGGAPASAVTRSRLRRAS